MPTHGEAKTSVPTAPITLQGLRISILTTQTGTSWIKTGCKEKKGRERARQQKKGGGQVNNRGNPWELWLREKRRNEGRREGEKERMRNRKIPEQQSAWRIKATLKIRLAQICSWLCRRVHSKLWRGCQVRTTDVHRCLRYSCSQKHPSRMGELPYMALSLADVLFAERHRHLGQSMKNLCPLH